MTRDLTARPAETVSPRSPGARILIYSHDTFGLGHLRRCRVLARALSDRFEDASILILSGSPLIGSFEFGPRVDFVRIPGVIKLTDGDYTSLTLPIHIEETIALRAAVLRHTAEVFAPDLVIVDKEPWGLRGELAETLPRLKALGARLVLGLRDVLDEPAALVSEWQRKDAFRALEDIYDDIWIYGLESVYEPLRGLDLGSGVAGKLAYTGYLERPLMGPPPTDVPDLASDPSMILVTPGGGGDGARLIDRVLSAYERARGERLDLPPALIVFGPFMAHEQAALFAERAEALPGVATLVFDPRIDHLTAGAAGVVAMGGYNTFCEILTHDKPALLAPRTAPRREQAIRAERAEALGLARMIGEDLEAGALIRLLRDLPDAPRPSMAQIPDLLSGMTRVQDLAAPRLLAAAAQ